MTKEEMKRLVCVAIDVYAPDEMELPAKLAVRFAQMGTDVYLWIESRHEEAGYGLTDPAKCPAGWQPFYALDIPAEARQHLPKSPVMDLVDLNQQMERLYRKLDAESVNPDFVIEGGNGDGA